MTTGMTTMMETMTTDPPHVRTDARQRPGVSVRFRIAVVVALLVALALGSAGLTIYILESARIENAANANADQEVAEFENLVRDGKDPNTGEPFANLEALMQVFLERNVPSEDELLVAWLDDHGKYASAATPEGFSRSTEFEETVRGHLSTGGQSHYESDAGEVMVTVQPINPRAAAEATGSREPGALVVVTFLDDARSELNALMRTYAIISLLSFGAIVALAAWQAGRLLAPLRQLNDTTREISGSDLSRRIPETGNDDITALTRTVNQMLARLEAAFGDQRSFLDSAGHELKTPLTVLRGHLELLDTGDAEDVEETKRLLLDEVDRMSRLVGDLILLAKSARPDFVTRQPVALDEVTESVLAKARGLGDREWIDDGAPRVVVPLDEQRVTQALLQLADNAVKHTSTGDTVAIGAAYDDSGARIWVRDSGDGVPARDRERIFERFRRSTVRAGDDGFGLGLSIVRAIAEGHGGTAHVEDASPRGSRFVITIDSPEPDPPKEDHWPAS